jgi:[ribosomal protein S18]-alanine N-acetyltransferase
MTYRFEPMSDEQARAVAAWHYDPPYDFYDWEADQDDLAELLDANRREDRYFAVLDQHDRLIGFFACHRDGDAVDIGLGLRPNLTGRGHGLPFMLAGLAFARERHAPFRTFQLAVAAFNERAIRVYTRAGFHQVGGVYLHHTNGGEHPFLRMERPA